MRRSNCGSVCTQARVGTIANDRPRSRASTRNSDASGSSTSINGRSRGSGTSPPASSRDMSSRPVSRSVVESSAPRTCRAVSRWRCSDNCCDSASVNSCAACKGCSRSWPIAVRKRLLASFACSASRLAVSSSAVRSATRCSSVSLACLSSRSAWREAVTSVYVATKPPPGMGLPRISTMLPSGNTRSVRCGVPARMKASRRSSARSSCPRCGMRCRAQRVRSAIGRPTCSRSDGKPNICA